MHATNHSAAIRTGIVKVLDLLSQLEIAPSIASAAGDKMSIRRFSRSRGSKWIFFQGLLDEYKVASTQ